MISLLVFFLILSLLVLVHEFGHFSVAKKLGVKVEEFGLGLPPRLFGKKIGETIYSFNLLPFGGFVRLLGEDDTELASATDPRNFMSKSPGLRAAILVAGVTMNLILGVSMFYLIIFSNDFKSLNMPLIFDYKFRFGEQIATNTVVMSFLKDSAAQKAGMEPGEAILTVNGVSVDSVKSVRELIKDKVGQKVSVEVKDLRAQGVTSVRTVDVVPTADTDGSGMLGAYLTKSVVISYSKPVDKLLAGPMHAYNALAYSLNAFGKLIGISVEEKSVEPVSSGVAGPVGIYKVVESILDYKKGDVLLSIMDLIGLMSISLALLNIMPFPALDGGRVVFVLIEKIRGKKVNPSIEAGVHKWGMIILFGFIILVTVKDILGFAR